MPLFADIASAVVNPALGIMIFALGGLAGSVFYLPFKKVKHWAWESYWMIYAVFGLLIVPWILAFCTSPNVLSVLKAAPPKELGFCFACGAMWGLGGMTWGLMIRYLGVGLGLAIGAGLCSASGTLVPPVINPVLNRLFSSTTVDTPLSDAIMAGIKTLYGTPSANMALLGVLISLAGIVLVGGAGMSKEKELPEEVKKATVAEYNFKLGIWIAIFSGIMSGAMGLGLQGGPEIEKLALTTTPITTQTWRGIPVLVVVLLGGFAVNFIYCLILNLKNKTSGDYVKSDAPIAANFFFAALAGAIWTSQFISFKTGEPSMGSLSYVGWAVLMASMILFSTIIGIFLGEWKNTSVRTKSLLTIGLAFLAISSVVSGYSGYLK